MTYPSHRLAFGALLLAATSFGCSRDGRAHAVAEPNSAHAEAHASTRGDHAYDESKVSRTGVSLGRDIIDACKVEQTETFFAFDSTALDNRMTSLLDQVAECAKHGALVGKELELIGSADPRGDDEYNKQLGISRAESVAKYLRDEGVPSTQIEINSVGELGASPDAEDWPTDRRVEIRIKAAG